MSRAPAKRDSALAENAPVRDVPEEDVSRRKDVSDMGLSVLPRTDGIGHCSTMLRRVMIY